MKRPNLIIFSVLLLYFCIPESDSIWCYQCGSVKKNQECETDIERLTKSATSREGNYAKDCSRQFQNQNSTTRYYCLIEIHRHTGGELLSFRRDCSDGVHFSYNFRKLDPSIPHLQHLKPNNQSACATYEEKQICLRLCDTDFCNGPEYPCKRLIYDDGRENVTCGSIGQIYTHYPVVFGTMADGMAGNIFTAPFILSSLLVFVLY